MNCSHLMHLPSGKCIGCGEQHQPLADYQPGDDEKYLADDGHSEAQPGQEQRMVTDAMIEAGYRAFVARKPIASTDAERLACEAIYTAMYAARPTADLGEDLADKIAAAMQQARDEIGATEQQRIAFGYAEAAMRALLSRSGDD